MTLMSWSNKKPNEAILERGVAMNNEEVRKLLEKAVLSVMKEGTVAVPVLLLKYYPKLKLSETEAMLLIHLIAFTDKEHKDFPTIEEIQSRMSANPETVIQSLQKLIKEGFISIDEETDPISGIHYERYNLQHLFEKIAASCVEEMNLPEKAKAGKPGKEGKDIFTVFENEFARPLTPMECETIAKWLDQDGYAEDLILAALKEAVFAGRVHFRYIDRILLEWSRNRVFTLDQAKAYAQKFRGLR